MYSQCALTPDQREVLLRREDDMIYSCGDSLFKEGDLKDIVFVREALTCEMPIETSYFSGEETFND